MIIDNPSHPQEVFAGDSDLASASRTTLLLTLGILFGNHNDKDLASFREEFPLPDPHHGSSLNILNSLQRLRKRYDIDLIERPISYFEEEIERHRSKSVELVRELYKNPSQELAADILLLSLNEIDETSRAAAAISAIDMFDNVAIPIRSLLSLLDAYQNERAANLAEVALKRFGALSLRRRRPPIQSTSTQPTKSRIKHALIVHGSLFSPVGKPVQNWWMPSGDFHDFIKINFRPYLYSKQDHFRWSGAWNDPARDLAAKELAQWADNRGLRDLDILAHSHGGNVAMLSTRHGLEVDHLVLLSCPIHWNYYSPNFSHVRKLTSYQIKLDWIILADRGRTHIPDPRATNKILPIWFWNHSDTHNPAIWNSEGLTV